jgi:hypothetical protein
MRSTLWPVAAFVVLFGLSLVASVIIGIFGLLALRHAKTKSRWGTPIWLTLFIEPDAFKGEAARYRRWYFYGHVVVLGLLLLCSLVLLAIKALGLRTG